MSIVALQILSCFLKIQDDKLHSEIQEVAELPRRKQSMAGRNCSDQTQAVVFQNASVQADYS